MAHIRGPDGRPIDDDPDSEAATRRVTGKRSTRGREASSSDEAPTAGARGDERNDEATVGRRSGGREDKDTSSSASPADRGVPPSGDSGGDEERTRLAGPRRRSAKAAGSAEEEPEAAQAGGRIKDPMDDPVVGWLVIVDGPGRGASAPLGYGMNSVGRAPTERVQIDFGDDEVSRSQHCLVTYDPKSRKFFIQHGGGRNLTYIGSDEQPVLAPVELKPGEEISIGATKLRFVPFCSEGFDWNDQ